MSENIDTQQGGVDDEQINRAQQVSKEGSDFKPNSVSIVDIDTSILEYLEDININVGDSSKKTVPIIYGSPEKWQQATKNGYIKDQKGQIQLPLIMFKRNNLSPDDNIDRKFNRHERISYTTGYSSKNRFDKFHNQLGLKATEELYKVRVGDHVQLDYEFIIWTDFIGHMNEIIEQLNWNSNEYWGVKNRKFKSSIDSFSTTIDTAEGTDRIVRTTFTLNVKGYLLPNSIEDSEMDEKVKKGYTTQKVITLTETETGINNINSIEELDAIINSENSSNTNL